MKFKGLNFFKSFIRLSRDVFVYSLFRARESLKFLFTGKENGGKIYFTFDDGPESAYTEKILDILKGYHVKATFFVLGENVARFPAIAKKIISEGHTLGNHGYYHRDLTALGEKEVTEDLENTREAIFHTTGKKVKLFRPPGAKKNEKLIGLTKRLGYDCVLCTIDPRDFDKKKTIFSIKYDILSKLTDGAIILLHCTSQRTVSILPSLIGEIISRGYKIEGLA